MRVTTKTVLFAAAALLLAAACASAAPEGDVAQSGRFTTLSTAPVAALEVIQLPGSNEFLLVVRDVVCLWCVRVLRAPPHQDKTTKHSLPPFQKQNQNEKQKDFDDFYGGASPDLNPDGSKRIWVWDRAAAAASGAAYTHVPQDEPIRKSCGSFVHLADGDVLLVAGHITDDRQTLHALSTTTYALTRRADLSIGRWYASSISMPDGA